MRARAFIDRFLVAERSGARTVLLSSVAVPRDTRDGLISRDVGRVALGMGRFLSQSITPDLYLDTLEVGRSVTQLVSCRPRS
jgi:hypothetical protein